MDQITESITYFAQEGRANLPECLRLAFDTVSRFELSTLVIFTGLGDGIQSAIDQYLCVPEFAHIRVVGVTFAQGFEVRLKGKQPTPHVFPPERQRSFREKGINVVRAHLPFDSISTQYRNQHGILAQDMGIVGNALNVFCGSMSLCVQAVLMACDAGEVEIGEHVVVMTSDTALIVRAAPTSRLLTDLIVRQIICKPVFLSITKSENFEAPETDALELQGDAASGESDAPSLE
ncbi:MAG: hypothetical protein WBY53_03290 [Acidobacteriaceae bacterium]